jgi:uncharacterized protein (TIGR02599 family)
MKKPPFLPSRGFTLVELLVGMSVLVLMFGLLMNATNQVVRTVSRTTANVEQFRGAREAFERITTRLSQATLNNYWDYTYDKTKNPPVPTGYQRRSELRFVSGRPADIIPTASPSKKLGHCVFFNAPLGSAESNEYRGLENVLNVSGFFVEYSQDTDYRPKFIGPEVPPKWRWKLMEYVPSSERFSVYRKTSGTAFQADTYMGKDWIVDTRRGDNQQARSFQQLVRPVVDNVVALILVPRLSRIEEEKLQLGNKDESPLAKDYVYDSTVKRADPRLNSRNQLPPVMQVTMVAIDERSAELLNLTEPTWDLFNVSTKFKQTADLSRDLLREGGATDSLEQQLIDRKVAYRIFTTNVQIRGAKWSREQAN